MNLNSIKGLLNRLRRGKASREKFVESHLNKGIAYQLRATRDALGWSQERLAEEAGMNQNAISRLESPHYGKPTITTLKRLAAAMDVALVVRFIPFSELACWVSGVPHLNKGLDSESLAVMNFDGEERHGYLEALQGLSPGQAWTRETQQGRPILVDLRGALATLSSSMGTAQYAGFRYFAGSEQQAAVSQLDASVGRTIADDRDDNVIEFTPRESVSSMSAALPVNSQQS